MYVSVGADSRVCCFWAVRSKKQHEINSGTREKDAIKRWVKLLLVMVANCLTVSCFCKEGPCQHTHKNYRKYIKQEQCFIIVFKYDALCIRIVCAAML